MAATDYDVIVIGAGPAGTSFARRASEKGLNVLVLDKRKDVGAPVRCGEGLGLKWYEQTGLPKNCGAIADEIKGAAVFAPDRTRITLITPETKGFVLERKIFDKMLAMQAGRAGAHVMPKTLVTDLVKEAGKIVGVKAVHYEEQMEFRAPLVISAEGMDNKIARQAGFPALFSLYDVDTCYQYEMVNVPCEGLIEIYFGNKLAPRGYAWVFPKGNDVANVGIGVGGNLGADPKALLDDFIAKDPRFAKAEAIEVKGGIISVGAPLKEMVKDNFMVIGTAAHQVDPIHGGGIGLAIESGFLAADVVAGADGDYSRKGLQKYETLWKDAEASKLDKRLKLRKVTEQLSDDDLNFLFHELAGGDLDLILKGDFAPVVAKVLLKRPSLLKVLSALI